MDNQDIKENNLEKRYISSNVFSCLPTLPEIFCEWWSLSNKDIAGFLAEENLSDIITEEQFINIILGNYHFSSTFIQLIKLKLPCNITLDKMQYLNDILKKKNTPELKLDRDLVANKVKAILAQKKKKRKEGIVEWHNNNKERGRLASKKYRLEHPEKIKVAKKKYREEHKEEIKAYKESRRDIENEQQRNRYHANLEESRRKGRERHKKYRAENLEKCRLQDKIYRDAHRAEINQRKKERMQDEEYRENKRAADRARYKEHSDEIRAKRRQERNNNLEQAKETERKYGATYRAKHHDEINERNRKRYQENLEENRIKSKEKQRRYRLKKRFKEQTGSEIFSLLEAIIANKQR